MLIRLLVACGVLMAASHVSAQHACGPGCSGPRSSGEDGRQIAGRFEHPPAMPPTQAYGYERQANRGAYGDRLPYQQDTRSYRGSQNGYSTYDRRQQPGYRMMQNSDASIYEQQPRSPNDTYQGERGHQHGGGCNHGHGHSHDGYSQSRGRRGSDQYREAPGGGGVLPQYEQPYPSDLQPMQQPSLPPRVQMQSRIERRQLPYSPPSRSRSDAMPNARASRSGYLNI